MRVDLKRYSKDILAAIRGDRYGRQPDGSISLFNDGLRLKGEYIEGVNGGDWRTHSNLIVDQGIINMFNIMLGSTSKISTWYLAPFSGSSAVSASWTAANITANSTEITATSPEGFSETVRQTITFTNATSLDQIDNYSSKAAFTIVTAGTLTVTGLFAVSSNVRGGTGGVLFSATKFSVARALQNGDVWNAGYRAVGTSS